MARPVETRRSFLWKSSTSLTALALSASAAPGDSPGRAPSPLEILHPRARVPLSFIIDDSTCLVNLAYYAMPQFAEAWPGRDEYRQPWRTWPAEIPDAFVREFGEWCGEHGVKGKYSVVPFPACVGWLDRELPGWSRAQLKSSIELVRDLMLPHWDIHPEMLTHTRVIDLKSGRPLEPANASTMENSYPQTDISVDHLAAYLAASLTVLKNCGLPCEGITTPGGFGNRVKDKLPLAVHQAVRDVFGSELPHYFKYVSLGDESVAPRLEFTTPARRVEDLTVNVPAGTGDWFGGWEGERLSEGYRYASSDARAGRMVELIERGDPAIMLCHWPGMYCNGSRAGFRDFQHVVMALGQRFGDRTLWMKLSEIARYWAARELTDCRYSDGSLHFDAPLDCPDFTVRCGTTPHATPSLIGGSEAPIKLTPVGTRRDLRAGTYFIDGNETLLCFMLPKGTSRITL